MIKYNDFILFQGDSITNAFRKPEEVCNAYKLGMGYAMIAASQILASRATDTLKFDNRGVAGEGLRKISARWQEDCLDMKPDILSFLAGVNDMEPTKKIGQTTIEEFEELYRALLNRTLESLPKIRFVLLEPFVLEVGEIRADRLADMKMVGDVVKGLAKEFKAPFVPLQKMLNEAAKKYSPDYWLFDGIHPTAQGHWLIANEWLKTVGEI